MQEVTIKTCSGLERYVWLDGALVRAEDRPQIEWYSREAQSVLRRELLGASPLIQHLIHGPGF